MADEDKDNFETEEDVIPAEVLDAMSKNNIGSEGDVPETPETDSEETAGDSEQTGDTDSGKEAEAGETSSTDADKAEQNETEDKGKEEGYEPIPQEQINTARRLGWSDDKIVKVAEESPEILEDLVTIAGRQTQQPQVRQEETAPEKKQAASNVQQVEGLDKITLDAEALKKMREAYGDDVVSQVITPLATGLNSAIDKINALGSSVKGAEETSKADEAVRKFDEANEVLDKLSETFEIFGKAKSLPKLADGSLDRESPDVAERSKVYDVAEMFSSSGYTWKESLAQAKRWYQGEYAEKSLTRKIVKDLNNRKKQFTPRPTGKKTETRFATREEEGVALVKKSYGK